ncbi:hypothetical protein [Skermania piniformis]|uniref:PE-PGRS family protein n=1 Tax=Skermania pinensis TaxID=39122 RepID=A0ABX8S4S9_9ACTN|nr:hypothetical protein [Skermania piniformis]QXQ12849.1 hypothetical protein KV203_13050 [Skermania piniformis]
MTNVDVTAIVLEKLRALFSEVFGSPAQTAQFLADPSSAFAAHDLVPSDLAGVDIDQLVGQCAVPGGSAAYVGGTASTVGNAGAVHAGAVAAAGSSNGYAGAPHSGDGVGHVGGGHPGDGDYLPTAQIVEQVTAITNQYYAYDDHSWTVTVIGNGNLVESGTGHAGGADAIAAGEDLGNAVTGVDAQAIGGADTGQANTGDGAVPADGGIVGSVNTGVIDDGVTAVGDLGPSLEFGAGSPSVVEGWNTGGSNTGGSNIGGAAVGSDPSSAPDDYTDNSPYADESFTDQSPDYYSDTGYTDVSDHLDAGYTAGGHHGDVIYGNDSATAIEDGPGGQEVLTVG